MAISVRIRREQEQKRINDAGWGIVIFWGIAVLLMVMGG